jgi:hypothetical protein
VSQQIIHSVCLVGRHPVPRDHHHYDPCCGTLVTLSVFHDAEDLLLQARPANYLWDKFKRSGQLCAQNHCQEATQLVYNISGTVCSPLQDYYMTGQVLGAQNTLWSRTHAAESVVTSTCYERGRNIPQIAGRPTPSSSGCTELPESYPSNVEHATDLQDSGLTHLARGHPCVVFPSLPVYITFSSRTAFPFRPVLFSMSFRRSARLAAAPRCV